MSRTQIPVRSFRLTLGPILFDVARGLASDGCTIREICTVHLGRRAWSSKVPTTIDEHALALALLQPAAALRGAPETLRLQTER